ncbi:subtilisin-like protein, partial [Melanomma pulvis-pyrius CBS 109.77]
MPSFPFPPGGNPFESSDQPAPTFPTGSGLLPNPSDQPAPGFPSGTGLLPNPTNLPDQPNPSDPLGNNPGFSKFPPPHIFDVVVDGVTYHLPSPEQSEMKILLLDGTFASLFANKVVLRGQTLEIPAGLSASQEIYSGGQSVTAQPGEAKEPESDDKEGGGGKDGKKGGGGVFGALGGLIGAAGKAAGSIADVGTGAIGLAGAAGGAAGGVAAGLTGTFVAASKNVGGLVSSLNGIQKAFPLADLAKTGLDSVMNAQNLGRDAGNWIQSMGKMVQGFDKLGPDEQQQMRNNIQEYTAPGGPLEKAGQAMRAFSDFPWSDQVLPTQIPTGSQPPDATQTQIPTVSTQLVQYFIVTKDGTSLETFDKFIKDLDGGVGDARTFDMTKIPHQNYMTNITSSQAENALKDNDFLLAVIPIVFNEDIGRSTHGTKMATIAGGKIHGIAPNADLFLVKTTGNFNRGPSTEQEEREEREGTRFIEDSNHPLQPGALEDSLNAVRDHILERLKVNPDAKSVINMSWGVQLDRGGAILENLFHQFFTWTEENKITVVLAAGNTASEQLHTKVPQKFGTPTNGIITVGGVKQDGTLYTPTSPEVPGQSGSMTVYAPAVDVVVPGPGNLDTGTSQAAAIVGGLAAYFYSLPGVALLHTPTVPAPDENMKEFIKSHAWTRVPLPLINPLSSLDVVYNLAHGDPAHAESPCAIHFKK